MNTTDVQSIFTTFVQSIGTILGNNLPLVLFIAGALIALGLLVYMAFFMLSAADIEWMNNKGLMDMPGEDFTTKSTKSNTFFMIETDSGKRRNGGNL